MELFDQPHPPGVSDKETNLRSAKACSDDARDHKYDRTFYQDRSVCSLSSKRDHADNDLPIPFGDRLSAPTDQR